MSDIVLSAGVRQNLLSLQKTADLMSTTQNRLATGKKVNYGSRQSDQLLHLRCRCRAAPAIFNALLELDVDRHQDAGSGR